ncbi:uncharacterized [Tachysurus ichikawai]
MCLTLRNDGISNDSLTSERTRQQEPESICCLCERSVSKARYHVQAAAHTSDNRLVILHFTSQQREHQSFEAWQRNRKPLTAYFFSHKEKKVRGVFAPQWEI